MNNSMNNSHDTNMHRFFAAISQQQRLS